MNKTEFIHQVHHTFQYLADKLEEQLDEKHDIDFQEGFLQITFPSGHIWLLNRHSPTQEIWLSSPVSGGFHFKFHTDRNKWMSTRSSEDDLFSFLEQELSDYSNSETIIRLIS